ncbi:MAG: tetratricopeptide repeat protein [Deinococcus sp.]
MPSHALLLSALLLAAPLALAQDTTTPAAPAQPTPAQTVPASPTPTVPAAPTDIQPADPQALFTQAQALAQQARASGSRNIDDRLWKAAAAAAEAAVQAAPQNPAALLLRANIYTDFGFWRQAEIAWDAYLRVVPGDLAAKSRAAVVEYNLGYSAYARGDVGSAPAAFARCLALDPRNADCALWGGRVALETGDFAGAAALYQQAGQLRPADKVAPYFLGVAQNAGKYGPAATTAFSRAYQQYDAGNKAAALSGYQAATAAAPNFVEAWREQGRVALELGNVDAALAAYTAAVALPGATAADRYNQGLASEGSRYGLGAVRAFRAAYARYAAGDKAGAEAGFLAATGQSPQYQKAWSWLGRVRYEVRNYAGASEAYTQATTLDPNDKAAAYYLRLSQSGK